MTKQILILGMGWVGQANAIGLIRRGWSVRAKDVLEKVPNLYNEEAFHKIQWLHAPNQLSDDIMVCVNCLNWNGHQDLQPVKTALAQARKLTSGQVILRTTILPPHLAALDFDVYYPEFLHERSAISEVLNPPYVVFALRGKPLPEVIREVNIPIPGRKIFSGSPEQCAFIKYLLNVWNALRIAFVNEFGSHCGDDADQIIDFLFERAPYLRRGNPFGGHCLPKDTEALATYFNMKVLQGALAANAEHKPSLSADLFHGDGR